MTTRIRRAVVDGVPHDIPEIWLVGMMRRHSLEEALRHWHAQAMMDRERKELAPCSK